MEGKLPPPRAFLYHFYWQDLHGAAYEGIFLALAQNGSSLHVVHFFQDWEMPGHGDSGGSRHLDFYGEDSGISFDEQVNLLLVAVPVKEDIAHIQALVDPTFYNFADNKGLEKRSCHGSILGNCLVVPTNKITHKPHIIEIYFWCFYHPFQYIVLIGTQKEDDSRSLQNRNPALNLPQATKKKGLSRKCFQTS